MKCNAAYNPILLFKEQGKQQDDNVDNFQDSDFILCIQTEFQRDMFQKFGHNTICIDSTHGTNMYDFNLITVVVVDEFGEGIPVGWMISNREDSMAIIPFFEAVKARCGVINPAWFMSDDSDNFFNAWKGVFGQSKTNKIICTWHLDRSWRKALLQHIKNKQSHVNVYHFLHILLNEKDETKFRIDLQEFLTYIQTNHHDFFIYFTSTYTNRIKQWASCFRIGATTNTNMYLESFHRVLKMIYLHHKQNRRIDTLLVTLLKVARDKAFERFRKMEIGKTSHRTSEINKRHKTASEILNSCCITPLEENKWEVASVKSPSHFYTIAKMQENCNCKVCCAECQICPHSYTCSCMDSLLHTTICKHVHLVHMTYGSPIANTTIIQSDDNYSYFETLLTRPITDSTLTSAKEFLNSKLQETEICVSRCQNLDAIKSATKHIQAAISVMSTMEQKTPSVLPIKRKVSPNENSERQRKFFTTKKEENKFMYTAIKAFK